MTLLAEETSGIILKTIITIESADYNGEKIMDKCSYLFNEKLETIIKENIKKLESTSNNKLLLEKIVVDLGNIETDFFETEIPIKLESELKKILRKYFHSHEDTPWKEKKHLPQKYFPRSEKSVPHRTFAGSPLIKKVDYYLHKGNWLSDNNKHPATNTLNIDREHWQQINYHPQQWLPMLAKHCLQPAGLSRLIKICQPDVLSMLCQLFTKTTTSEFVNYPAQIITDKKVTPEKLSLAAEYYLQHQVKHTHATQQALGLQTQNKQTSRVNITQNDSHLLKQHHNKTDMPMDAVPPFALQPMQISAQSAATQQHHSLIKKTVKQNPATLQNRQQHKELLKTALSAQISSIQPDNGIQTPSAQSILPISNAGCMILWPLLPTFFRAFDLLDTNRFISLEVQREAVCLLDWLIWAEEGIPAWRLALNKVICGLPINDNSLWHSPEPGQRAAINQWLEKTLIQLPAWEKMGASDVRHLFLQRSGELSELNGVTNIHIQPEVYDALISEWPWPMNIASFSWLKHPITITWL
ncbi:contractile injection system tape measure protein [Xenorhabdus koppenhoeferi]|uniref:Uncharacterized protein n=1 Tax=Xenorhabdus koppenhoeferi TaxID=351659 RepID=A0A1I7HKW0_9GAMM|nr:contractile injection system tape measure protein [Xenorhabdus koppenhoeferi]SFU61282.1 hypothetical protein SAMN05421784_11513 [Xenorhabdus koppenhoeferi]